MKFVLGFVVGATTVMVAVVAIIGVIGAFITGGVLGLKAAQNESSDEQPTTSGEAPVT